MPNKKKKSGSGDGYTPSRLGREGRPGDGSPGGSDPGTPRSGGGDGGLTRESSSDVPPYESDPLPGWTGLEAHAPCEEATRVTLDVKMPVAAGIGVHVHVLMSQQLMTRASLGAGDWVALAVCEGPEAVGNVGGAPGGPPGTPGTPRGASTPGTPGSATRQAAQALVGLSIADPPPAPAVHIPALLARNVTLDSASAPDGTSHGASAAAAAAATGKLGRFTVMARVHPNPKANGLDAVQLARKVWHSLGSPAAGAKMLVLPLNVGAATPLAAPALVGPMEGAPCAAKATLRLWATEGDSANAGWLEKGLGGGDEGAGDDHRAHESRDATAVGARVAREARDGRPRVTLREHRAAAVARRERVLQRGQNRGRHQRSRRVNRRRSTAERSRGCRG